MLSLDYWFPEAFAVLALAHFVALLSPGPDFFLISSHGLRHKFAGASCICVGIALGNALYIALAIAGWSGVRQIDGLYLLLKYAGALYLAWLGVQLLKSRPRGLKEQAVTCENQPLSFKRQLMLGLGSAVLNPKNALFYISLMGSILGPQVTLLQQAVSGIWMVCVVLFWDLALVALISQQTMQRALNQRVHLIERGSGTVLLGFAAMMVW